MGTKRLNQEDLFPSMKKDALAGFGGGKTKTANPTTARPFARNTPTHIVLRSELARGERSFLLFDREIGKLLNLETKRVGAVMMQASNAGNHLHLLVRFPTLRSQRSFLRAISGLIARLVLKAKKGTSRLKNDESFWAGRPFSRIVGWARRPLATVQRYVQINAQELAYKGSSLERRSLARNALKNLEELGLISFGRPRKT